MLVKRILNEKGDEVYHISPDHTVYEAIKKMSDKSIGALLVMEKDELYGIISERDYREKVILKGRTSKTTKVKEIMTSDVYWVSPQESLEECMALMTNKKIRHLPIMEDEKVIGVISIGDIIKQIISKQKVEIDHLKSYIGGSYPG